MSNVFFGGAGGAGFQLFKKSTDGLDAIFADAAARDVYFGANPGDLALLDANENLIIKLLDNGSGEVAYQQRQASAWVDVTSLVQGEPGEDSVDVSELAEGDTVRFNSTTQKLEPAPANVDATTGEFTFNKSINVPAGSINVGEVLQLSEGTADLVIVDLLKDQMSFSVNSEFDDSTGSSLPSYIDFGAPFILNINTDDSQTLTDNPLTFSVTGTVSSPDLRLIDQITIRTGSAMTNFAARLVDNATGLAIRYIPNRAAFESGEGGLSLISGDNVFFFVSNAADTAGNFHLGFSPFVIEDSQQIDFTVTADSVDVLGNVSGIPYLVAEAHDGPPTSLQTSSGTVLTEGSVPFANASGHLVDDNASFSFDDDTDRLTVANLTVTGDSLFEGTTTIINTENLSVSDSFIDLNSGLTPVVAREGGIVVNYLPTSTNDSVTAGAFVAGIDPTSNPTVETDTATVFSGGDILQISGTLNGENDGIYEALVHSSNLLTIKGVGVTATVEAFSRNQFVANASDNATITQINVSVMRAGTDGAWEQGLGSSTPITYTDLGDGDVAGPSSSIQDHIVKYDDTTGKVLGIGEENIIQAVSSGGSPNLGFADESGIAKASVTYDDSIPQFVIQSQVPMNISTAGGTRKIELEASGEIELRSASSHEVTLNLNTSVSDDGKTVIINATGATDKCEIQFQDETPVTKGQITLDNENDRFEIETTDYALVIGSGEDRLDLFCGGTGATDKVLLQHTSAADTKGAITMRQDGTNGGTSDFHIGTRDPEGEITADGGAIYIRDEDASSDIYVKKSNSSNTDWVSLSVPDPTTIAQIFRSVSGTTISQALSSLERDCNAFNISTVETTGKLTTDTSSHVLVIEDVDDTVNGDLYEFFASISFACPNDADVEFEVRFDDGVTNTFPGLGVEVTGEAITEFQSVTIAGLFRGPTSLTGTGSIAVSYGSGGTTGSIKWGGCTMSAKRIV